MHRFKRPDAATIIAFVALFAVLGGSAYAAAQITSADIKNGTIKAADLSRGAKKALKGKRGPRGFQGAPGIQGPQGPQGARGPAGPSALSGITIVGGTMTVLADTVDGGVVACPPGTRAIGGGFAAPDGGVVFLNAAAENRSGWAVALDNLGGTSDVELLAEAYCAGAGKAVAAKAPASTKMRRLKGKLARIARARAAH